MSDFLWKALDESEGLAKLVGLERERGYLKAQE